ncbi:MAG: HD domain-containing protein [Bacteroidales bacterium]|nr:HD domain-containing protein [Bacteroidales bacterium]
MNYLNVDTALQQYVAQHILPLHDHYDEAHQRSHIETVISNSMAMAQHYDVNPDMVYAIAAYHDTGICEGRERHHLVSGRIVRNDVQLQQWFNAEQTETMAQAVEDHRASSQQEPRSIYGKIVAEADRDIDSEKIVLRTLQYGWDHYPDLGKEEQWQRMVDHLEEKYSENGYLRLWLPESPNAQRLEELRQLIKDRVALRALFERLQRPQQES